MTNTVVTSIKFTLKQTGGLCYQVMLVHFDSNFSLAKSGSFLKTINIVPMFSHVLMHMGSFQLT